MDKAYSDQCQGSLFTPHRLLFWWLRLKCTVRQDRFQLGVHFWEHMKLHREWYEGEDNTAQMVR